MLKFLKSLEQNQRKQRNKNNVFTESVMNIIKQFIILCLLATPSFGQEIPNDRMQRVYEATVRISTNGCVGTGSVFDESNDFYYILTNEHVVGDRTFMWVEYTKDHIKSKKIKARVIGRKNTSGITFDVAVLKLPKKSGDADLPDLPVIPISKNSPTMESRLLLTCGCQGGAIPSIQQCYIKERQANLIKFTPTSLPGRSGSMLCDIEGMEILGLVAWMSMGDNPVGIAMTGDSIRNFCYGIVNADKDGDNVLLNQLQKSNPAGVARLPLDASEIPLAREIRKNY